MCLVDMRPTHLLTPRPSINYLSAPMTSDFAERYADEKGAVVGGVTEAPYLKPSPKPTWKRSVRALPGLLFVALVSCIVLGDVDLSETRLPSIGHSCHRYTPLELESAKCPAQPPALNVGADWNPLTDSAYAELAARRLSQAVQIRTESYDDMPLDPKDGRYAKMYVFSRMLEVEFPKVYHALEHRAINTHAHLFEWKGKDESLQPVLLMAHLDTVPVPRETYGLWRYPPYGGSVTVNGTDDTPGTWIWGRGSSDCKNSLMGIMGAVERLVTEGYTPDRTVVLAFGFDEEVSQA